MPEKTTAGEPRTSAGPPARLLWTCLASAALLACGSSGGTGPAPVPRSITPATGFTGLTTSVQISGDGFAPRATGGDHVDTHHRAWLGDTELADVTWIDGHTLSATVPAGLAPGVLPLEVENAYGRQGTLADAFTVLTIPSSLTASIAASRPSAGLDQPFDVTFTVTNGGTGAADLGLVSPSLAGPAATCGAVTPATALTLAAGATQRYTWSCTGSAEGALALDATVSGTDAASGAPLSVTAAAPAQVAIQSPAALTAALAVDGSPATIQVGQAFTLEAAVTNHGGAAATLTSITVTPEVAGCGAPAPALPLALAGGLGVTFSLTCAAATTGALAPAISVRGQDGNSGGLVTASATLVPLLTARPPAALTATVTATPTALAVGQTTSVTFYVTNGASLPNAQLTSVAPSVTGPGAATCTSVKVPHGSAIGPGAMLVFGWKCTAAAAGEVLLGGSVSYTVGGKPGSASPVVPVAATITP